MDLINTINQAKKKDFALTLARGLTVIDTYSAERPTMTTSEIARRVGISRAAARRLLLTLVAFDYLECDGPRFRATQKILNISGAGPIADAMWQKITADVLAISNRFNEPCSVAVLNGMNIVFVVRDSKRRIFSAPLSVGDKLPAHCSAGGKVLLASLEPDTFRQRLSTTGPLRPRTANSIVAPDELARELRLVRRNGWAKAEDEMEVGTIAVAVPLFDKSNDVIAALTISSHKSRRSMDELIDDFLPVIQNAADRISDSLAEADH